MSGFFEIFAYGFVQKALFVGVLVAFCASLLGVFLVLKNYSLIGHGLSDVGFASLSLALALGLNPLWVSVPLVISASFLIMALSQRKNIAGDIAIGVSATTSLAIGIIITSVTKGFNIDVYNYMFGSILSLTTGDVIMSAVLALVVIILFVLFYNRLFIITCDEEFAKASGINVMKYQFLISFLTALTIVIGMRMMGTLLISSLIIFPAITAKNVVSSFKHMICLASIVSVVCFVVGMLLSFLLDLPTGPSIVVVNIIFMIVTAIFRQFTKKGWTI